MNRSTRLFVVAAGLLFAARTLPAELSCAPTSTLKDSSFELATGTPPNSPHWTESSTNFGSPLCTIASCIGSASPRTGLVWSWFGGISSGNAETAALEQSFDFPSGTEATLTFYLGISLVSSPFTDELHVKVDGAIVDTFVEPAGAEILYTLRSVDLSTYSDGLTHAVRLEYVHPAGGGTANFNVDDVKLSFTQVITFGDGGFEAATGCPPNSPYWTETSTTWGSPLWTVACGAADVGAAPHGGGVWSWFGGNGTSAESAGVTQTVMLPHYALVDWLTYRWIGRVTAPFTDTLAFRADGDNLLFVTEPATPEPGYALNLLYLDNYADGQFHGIGYAYNQPVSGGRANFNIDDVSITLASCTAILLDGFETHDTSNWSASVP